MNAITKPGRPAGHAPLLAFALLLSGCSHMQLAKSSVSQEIPPAAMSAMQDAALPVSALGGVVLRVRDGRVVWEMDATRAMQPASTIKVLTSIVALETLKPSYRARTTLVSSGAVNNQVLQGDLALVGGGADEVQISSLESMLRTLRASGIRAINGDLVLDRELFQPPRPYENALPFDEAPEFRYNVIPDALMLGSNLNQLAISSNDSEVRIVFGPAMADVQFVSEMTLNDKECGRWEDDWKIPRVEKLSNGVVRVALLGAFPKNCAINTEINVLDRTEYAERIVRSMWTSLGGEWNGRAKEGVAPKGPSVRQLASVDSRSLAEFNREINKRSDNPMTRIAYLTLGVKATDLPAGLSTSERADAAVRRWLASKNIDATGLVLENGSGLSRKEMISPMTLAQVLRAAHASPWASEFMMSLPIVGVDGAMRNRLKDTKAADWGRMKTGGLRNVTSVAGYLPDKNGEVLVVVLFLNHDNVRGGKGRAVLDVIMRSLIEP